MLQYPISGIEQGQKITPFLISKEPNFRLRISVVSPVYNEIIGISSFVTALLESLQQFESRYDIEIILVDDGSSDGTAEKLREVCAGDDRIRVLTLMRNFGHQPAILAGMNSATGDCIITLDSDFQDPPGLIAEFVSNWENGFHHVAGRRIDRNHDSIFKRFSAGFFYFIQHLVADAKPFGNVADYRLVSRTLWDQMKMDASVAYFLRGSFAWAGVPTAFVDYERPERHSGNTKYTLWRMLNLARNGLIFSSVKPLKLAGYFVLMFSLSTFGYAIFILGKIILIDPVLPSGFSTLVLLVLAGFSTLSLIIAILSSYIARIFEIQVGRPAYLLFDIDE
jgi:glycosyltransferase involved in cell wall biosynthesis